MAGHRRPARPLSQRKHTHTAAGGSASKAGRVEAEKGGRNRTPTTFKLIDNHANPYQPRHAPPPRASHSSSSSSSSGGMGWQLGGRKRWGNQRNGVIMLQRDTSTRSPESEPGARRKMFSYTCCGCSVAATGRLELAVGVTIEIVMRSARELCTVCIQSA